MMKLSFLSALMRIDAAVLLLLGMFLLLVPDRVEQLFQFKELPPAVGYLLGMWGCGLVTMGFGYFVAAANPVRHVVWVQVGIARGGLECLLGVICVARGVVTFQQAAFGMIIAGMMALAYLALYPRAPRIVPTPATPSNSSSKP